MKSKADIKHISTCEKHYSFKGQNSNVCIHLEKNLVSIAPPLAIVPLFIERILFDKFYEKYWICQECADACSISQNGELWFDPNLRLLLEDEDSNEAIDDEFVIEIGDDLKKLIKHVCPECLLDKYRKQIEAIESSISSLYQRPFNNQPR